MEKLTIKVAGMACGHCEIAVQEAIRELPGVRKAKASKRKKEVTIEFDPALVTLDQIRAEITKTGYDV